MLLFILKAILESIQNEPLLQAITNLRKRKQVIFCIKQCMQFRSHFRVVLATFCGLGNQECHLGNLKVSSWKFKIVVNFLIFTCLLFRRCLSVPWSVYVLCKFFENSTTCVSIWRQTTKGSTLIFRLYGKQGLTNVTTLSFHQIKENQALF